MRLTDSATVVFTCADCGEHEQFHACLTEPLTDDEHEALVAMFKLIHKRRCTKG
ncbi:MAG: hypothetical protein V4472_24840 [Pseudomonadota bacterium]